MTKHIFEDWQVELVSMKLAMENNAFLRVILANQLIIMERLGMSTNFPVDAYHGARSDIHDQNTKGVYQDYLKGLDAMTGELTEKWWQYAQLKLKQIDPQEDSEN